MGAPTPEFVAKTYYLARFFAENYMKMKEIGTREGRVPSAPLDSPMGILRRGDTPTENPGSATVSEQHSEFHRLKMFIVCSQGNRPLTIGFRWFLPG